MAELSDMIYKPEPFARKLGRALAAGAMTWGGKTPPAELITGPKEDETLANELAKAQAKKIVAEQYPESVEFEFTPDEKYALANFAKREDVSPQDVLEAGRKIREGRKVPTVSGELFPAVAAKPAETKEFKFSPEQTLALRNFANREDVLPQDIISAGQSLREGKEMRPVPTLKEEIFKMPEPGKGKPSAAESKRLVEEGKLADELGGLLSSFTRAKEEGIAGFPAFGTKGIGGRISGKVAGISGKMGYSPAINVYNAQRKAFATVVAKAAGEVRPTDEDIKRFLETLPDTAKSDEENALLIGDIQAKTEKGGIASLWPSAKGQSQYGTSGKVKMLSPDGKQYSVDTSEVDEAQKNGWSVAQ